MRFGNLFHDILSEFHHPCPISNLFRSGTRAPEPGRFAMQNSIQFHARSPGIPPPAMATFTGLPILPPGDFILHGWRHVQERRGPEQPPFTTLKIAVFAPMGSSCERIEQLAEESIPS